MHRPGVALLYLTLLEVLLSCATPATDEPVAADSIDLGLEISGCLWAEESLDVSSGLERRAVFPVVLTNDCAGAQSIDSLALRDLDGAFELAGAVPAEIPAGGSAEVEIAFTPSAEIIHLASLDVVAGGEARSVELFGQVSRGARSGARPTASVDSKNVYVEVGETAAFDGSSSSDPEGDALTYRWTFQSVPSSSALTNADISGAYTATAEITPDVAGRFRLRFVVGDGTTTGKLFANAWVSAAGNTQPSAYAGANFDAVTGELTALDGSGSSDAEGDALSYTWSFASVPAGSALGAMADIAQDGSADASFTPDVDGTYNVRMVVSDGALTAKDFVKVTAASEDTTTDADGDGHTADVDCDDADASVTAGTWYPDADGDGYGAADGTPICAEASGYLEDASDCDDSDGAISPDAEDADADGVDSDCDGHDLLYELPTDAISLWGEAAGDQVGRDVAPAGDVDGDGAEELLICASSSDVTAYVVSGAISADMSLADADVTVTPETGSIGGCSAVAGVGDVDGDGYDDVLVGSIFDGANAGEVFLLSGPLTADLSLDDATARFTGEAADDWAGYAVAGAGDVDADGYADFLIGATDGGGSFAGAGAAYLLYGPTSSDLSLADADVKLSGETNQDHAGHGVDGADDMDGDGYDDFLIGAYGDDDRGSKAGAAYLLHGPVTADMSLADADVKITGRSDNDYTGDALAGAGDVNGDGYPDLLIGARNQYADSMQKSGASYLVLGPVTADMNLSKADAQFNGEGAWDTQGSVVDGAGDVNGDGYDDLLLGASGNDYNGSYSGAAYVLLGPVTGTLSVSAADVKFVGGDGDRVGYALAGVGDLDGDGYDDVLIGADLEDTGGESAGAVYLIGGGLLY